MRLVVMLLAAACFGRSGEGVAQFPPSKKRDQFLILWDCHSLKIFLTSAVASEEVAETQGRQIAELQQGMAALTQQVGDLRGEGDDKTRLIEGLREELEAVNEQLGRQDDGDGQAGAAVDARLERLEEFARLNGA